LDFQLTTFIDIREIDKQSEDQKINQWFEASKMTIDLIINEGEKKEAKQLLYTWWGLFCNDVRDL
jgi:phosphoribosylformimino-5-aminoimidazole carboxamide ribonucleotide (ProFAR) isomerase